MKFCGVSAFLLIVLGFLFLGQILALADQQISGVDALRCDSCGQECAVVCGSRQFRTCCFNYIKKRGDPSVAPIAGQELGLDDKGGSGTKLSKIHPSSVGVVSRFPSKHFRRSIGGGLLGLNNDLPAPPLTIEYPDDPTWFPYVGGDIYRLEDEDRAHGSRFRLF